MHAASVNPEPGSNSHVCLFVRFVLLRFSFFALSVFLFAFLFLAFSCFCFLGFWVYSTILVACFFIIILLYYYFSFLLLQYCLIFPSSLFSFQRSIVLSAQDRFFASLLWLLVDHIHILTEKSAIPVFLRELHFGEDLELGIVFLQLYFVPLTFLQ